MNTGENVMNAFNVVAQTYANLKKMFDQLDEIAEKNNAHSIVGKPGFLRWSSDMDTQGWYPGALVKLYQKKDEAQIGNTLLHHDSIYSFEVIFWFSSFGDSPEVVLSKIDYNDIVLNGKVPSISEHWRFHTTADETSDFSFHNEDGKIVAMPRSEKISSRYGNLKKKTFKRIRLMNISADNIDYVFKEMLEL